MVHIFFIVKATSNNVYQFKKCVPYIKLGDPHVFNKIVGVKKGFHLDAICF